MRKWTDERWRERKGGRKSEGQRQTEEEREGEALKGKGEDNRFGKIDIPNRDAQDRRAERLTEQRQISRKARRQAGS